MLNTYGGNNQIEHWIRCMVTDELKQRDHNFVRRACESVIRDHVLNELNIIVRSKSEKCTCENRVPSEEDKKKSTDGLYIIYKDGNLMAHYMDELNKAFTYVSASPLSSTWYWSSTESSQAVAWYVVFSSGLTGTGNKHIGDMVRTVIDF